MIARYVNLMKTMPRMKAVRTAFSLVPFVAFMERKAGEKNSVRARFFSRMVERVRAHEGWERPLTRGNLREFRELLEIVYFTLSAPVTDEKEHLWALSEPLSPRFYYGTGVFYELVNRMHGTLRFPGVPLDASGERASQRIRIIYTLILKQFYDYDFPGTSEIKASVTDADTGLARHYSISFDTRFIDVAVSGELPRIDTGRLDVIRYGEDAAVAYLQEVLPLERFRFTGFSVVAIREVTGELTIERIKDEIVNLSGSRRAMSHVADALRPLLGHRETYVSLLPMLKVNGRLVTDSLEEMDGAFQQVCLRHQVSRENYLDLLEGYLRNPRLLAVDDIGVSPEVDVRMKSVFRIMGIESLAVVPVFFRKELVGVAEVFSMKKDVPASGVITRLKPVIPLLEQLFQAAIHLFNNRIDAVIKDQFTTLHPSVQWRFNEAAWNFIRKRETDPGAVMEQVGFREVYPLYGAVDVRDSTVQRAAAVRRDMVRQLERLGELLGAGGAADFALAGEVLFKTREWLGQITDHISPEEEFRLKGFLTSEARPLVELLARGDSVAAAARDYLDMTAPDGVAHRDLELLETAMARINRTISRQLEKMNDEIQQVYPCYFEKFRTDGIEYDLYAGESISPSVPFRPFHLKSIRGLQLASMARIAGETAALRSELAAPLETTQLIYINAGTIDISFRGEERRFDVEGGYNVRYEMIKKRIDKACVTGSGERVTQPGKIALIYSRQQDIEPYLDHIAFLRNEGLLSGETEHLDIEPLQGLDGLRALRVTVQTPTAGTGDV
jgi:hypothetical protein